MIELSATHSLARFHLHDALAAGLAWYVLAAQVLPQRRLEREAQQKDGHERGEHEHIHDIPAGRVCGHGYWVHQQGEACRQQAAHTEHGAAVQRAKGVRDGHAHGRVKQRTRRGEGQKGGQLQRQRFDADGTAPGCRADDDPVKGRDEVIVLDDVHHGHDEQEPHGK